MAGDIWVVTLASRGAIGTSCVDTGDTSEYPTMHRKAPQQRIIWLQVPIVLRLKNLVGTFYQQMKKVGWGCDREVHVRVYESCLAVVYFALVLPKVHWLELSHMTIPNSE